MYIYGQFNSGVTRSLINANLTSLIRYNSRRDEVSVDDVVIASSAKNSDVSARFDDICAAIADGNVNLYDCNKEIGYWKPAQKRTPAAAKKAPATK